MKAEYERKKEQFTDPDFGTYTAYAVVVKVQGTVVRCISDVFLSEAVADQFISLCNKLELDPVHLEEAIEDALA